MKRSLALYGAFAAAIIALMMVWLPDGSPSETFDLWLHPSCDHLPNAAEAGRLPCVKAR